MIATVYTTKTCAYCPMVKKYLTYKGIKYTEKDAEQPEIRDEAIKLSGAMTVPITVIDDQVIVGWKPQLLSAAIS